MGLLGGKLTEVWALPRDLEFLSLRLVHTEPPAVHQLQLSFSYSLQHWLLRSFGFFPGSHDFLYPPDCLSNLGEGVVLWPGSKKNCWFSLYSAFSLLEDGSGNCQAPNMLDQKMIVSLWGFYICTHQSCLLSGLMFPNASEHVLLMQAHPWDIVGTGQDCCECCNKASHRNFFISPCI